MNILFTKYNLCFISKEEYEVVIKVVELCWVDYVNEEDIEKESDEKLTATRTVVYESPKKTLLEAYGKKLSLAESIYKNTHCIRR